MCVWVRAKIWLSSPDERIMESSILTYNPMEGNDGCKHGGDDIEDIDTVPATAFRVGWARGLYL